VSNESKVLLGVGAGVVLGFLVALSWNMTAGLFVMLAGIAGAILALRFLHTDDDPFADARSAADEAQVGNITPSQPLAPWSPDGGLDAWTPPVSYAPLPDAPAPPPAPVEVAPEAVPEPSAWSDTWSNDDNWSSAPTTTWEPTASSSTDTNPLDELQGLDTLDPIAEVERIEARADQVEPAPAEETFSTFSFSNVAPVNEAVTDAEDIMAASQATELHLTPAAPSASGEQTELQKLLAKVQIRLSAYE
jgi:hypothetical protein